MPLVIPAEKRKMAPPPLRVIRKLTASISHRISTPVMTSAVTD